MNSMIKACLFSLFIGLLPACSHDGKWFGSSDEVPVTEKQVTVHGSAPITTAGVEQSRQAAIDAAIESASQQLRRKTSGSVLVSDVKVVDEWQEDNFYHVQAVAVLSASQLCASSYRKKIVATAFPLMNGDQIAGTESQDLFSGIPREISNRLMESGDFIARNQTNTFLYARPDIAPEIPASGVIPGSPILNLARTYDAQLVLSGVIRDFRVESTDYVRGSGAMAQLKWAMRDVIARRSIGIDVYVHDGFTGALVFQHRYTDSILGDVTLPSGYTVGSERFESIPAGHAISQIIHQASDDIRQLFACHPLAVRVTRVDGNRITIAAGGQDKLKQGDRLNVYSAGFSHTAGLGFNQPLGLMVLSDVGPTQATGFMESNLGVVMPGDWVRSVKP